MSNAISVSIQLNNPCSEDWNGMEPTEQGRFCNSCQKPVIDFTHFTDQQILEYFLQHPFPVCGRIGHTQRDRHYSPSTVKTNRHLSPVAATLMTLATITTEAACSETERVKPLQVQSVDKQTPGVRADSVIISGTVKDAHGKRLENVEIVFDKYKTLTDKHGNFQFTFSSGSPKPGVIQFSYAGLERQVRSYYPIMGSTSYEVQFPEADFPQFIYGGSMITSFHIPVPDSLTRFPFQSLNLLSQKTRSFLGNLAQFIKDNPVVKVTLAAYYKTSSQKAVKLQHQIKDYLVDKEGVNAERFEFAQPQLRKKIRSEVIIQFSSGDE
ncbi:hypothetical protein A3860_17125 [Niastella vici]|uniref:TonB C-terminal domain-containing protein n=1 Tax=Niastella vici TaxID=1703345 RepID=A0A1V9G4G2_9BACT|nr:carboxypeptidase-like regulatory domain-containing protein [Niastella vici]OQP65388.1 hypothetical protein A3860_17125 [Niastella vici]